MAFFSMRNMYEDEEGVVTCGSRVEGCMNLKDFDKEPQLFAPMYHDGPSAATRDHLDAAAQDINDAIDDILSKVEKDHPKPQGTTGFDLVVTPQGFKLAYCKRAAKVLRYRTREERGLIRRAVARVARPAYFKRER